MGTFDSNSHRISKLRRSLLPRRSQSKYSNSVSTKTAATGGTAWSTVEGCWNNGFRQLVGHSHPGVWTAIESLHLNQAMSVTSLIMQHARGQLPPKRVRRARMQLRKRLHLAVLQPPRPNKYFAIDACLRGIGHTVRLA